MSKEENVEVPVAAIRRLEEAIEEIAHMPIISAGSAEPAWVTLEVSEVSRRIEAAREAVKLLPIPDADPVLTEVQRDILQEAASAYDGPLERRGRHDLRRELDRAVKIILHREGI